MTKKHFIQLADAIRANTPSPAKNETGSGMEIQHAIMRNALADFCRSQNPRFNRERWIGYINGENTANGKPLPTCVRGMGALCAYHASKPNGKKGCFAGEVSK